MRNFTKWAHIAMICAFKTFIQTAVAVIIVEIILRDIQWASIVYVSLIASAISVLTISFSERTTDGSLLIDLSDPDKDIYRLDLDTPLDTLNNKQIIKFIVKKGAILTK